jgi:hypothetical protein
MVLLASHFMSYRHGASLHYNTSRGMTHLESLEQAIREMGHPGDVLGAEAVYIGHGMSALPAGITTPSALLMPRFYEEINARLNTILPLEKDITCIAYHLTP